MNSADIFMHIQSFLLQKKNTTQQIGKILEEMGLTPHYYPDYNGLWAMLEGGKASTGTKTVALRADIDALPVEEHTGLSFCSQTPGVMHACGHDCHIAMLLGGIRMLMARREDLKGNVKSSFRPLKNPVMVPNTILSMVFWMMSMRFTARTSGVSSTLLL